MEDGMKTLQVSRLVRLAALLITLTALATVPARAAEQPTSNPTVENTIAGVTIDPTTSVAMITGTVTCSSPMPLTVYGWARQLHGNRFAQQFGGSEVVCETTATPYTVTLTPGSVFERLVPGFAYVGTWAEGCSSGRCSAAGADGEMRLMPALR
jgi:hypothetical protein